LKKTVGGCSKIETFELASLADPIQEYLKVIRSKISEKVTVEN
jgi:hypothetical protein